MSKNKVKYIGFYDLPLNNRNRVSNLAAINKMNYVIRSMNKIGYGVEIISPSWLKEESAVKYDKFKRIKFNSINTLVLFPSWKTKSHFMRNIKILFTLIFFCVYLIINTKRDEKIIVYHAQWLSYPIKIAKKIKRFNIILEVEEIYSEVWKESQKLKKMEFELINLANAYICVSNRLERRLVNHLNKPSIVLYGNYEYYGMRKHTFNRYNDINLVYAGSIDSTKGGAFIALDTMRYLPNNYKLTILGTGSPENIHKMQSIIEEINQTKKSNVCNYRGVLTGQEFSTFLFKCQIALNPQKSGNYMETAFPSKVMTYLGHGLKVVSTQIVSIVESPLGKYVNFSINDSPVSIAKTILNVSNDSVDTEKILNDLDIKFRNELKCILEGKLNE
ncbi:MAG TPA: glycosyltransferase family 4 protein [Gallicola sp.]|nr:glycosyltransferase family 4 protein [Gallicola sp.]